MMYQGLAKTLVHASKYILDPNIIDAGANIIVAVQGSITVTGSAPNKVWTVNADEISTYDSYGQIVDIEMPLSVRTAPTLGDIRAWGLKTPGLGNRGRIEFDITDTVFSIRVYNETGTLQTVFNPMTGQALTNAAITWDAAWTNTIVRYRIQHLGDRINFLINESIIGFAKMPESTLPNLAQHAHILNTNSDDMEVAAIILRNAFNL